MKHILDPTFQYTAAVCTDIRKLFERERKRIADELAAKLEVTELTQDEAEAMLDRQDFEARR